MVNKPKALQSTTVQGGTAESDPGAAGTATTEEEEEEDARPNRLARFPRLDPGAGAASVQASMQRAALKQQGRGQEEEEEQEEEGGLNSGEEEGVVVVEHDPATSSGRSHRSAGATQQRQQLRLIVSAADAAQDWSFKQKVSLNGAQAPSEHASHMYLWV
jgi:hypothetical protein